jgi:hypothetical protein
MEATLLLAALNAGFVASNSLPLVPLWGAVSRSDT